MNKDNLLDYIATTAYNVGFGAKKHFATYDIVEKMPGLIGFVSIAFGVYALVFDYLGKEFFSATLVVLGVVGLYISFYDGKKKEYELAGVELTKLLNNLAKIYHTAKTSDESENQKLLEEVSKIEEKFYGIALSKQILFSNWYAHYKFFWEQQIDWIDERKKFKLLRDKIPLSFMFLMLTGLIIIVFVVSCHRELLPPNICK